METKALLVLDTWVTSTDFKTDLVNTMKSNGLNIITDLEATDIVLAVNYMTSLIYSYYKNYYLSNASKERTLELMSITASGKLNFYASELKAYKDAYAHDFKSLGGNENSSSHDTTLNRSGKSKQATTPETIAKGADYIDDYSSSEQKYENANTEKGTRSFNSTIKGSEQDYWKNIISIPKRLYEDIIGSFSKFFFSSSMELIPCAVLTIEQAIQKLKDEIKVLDTTTSTEINSLKPLIKINQEEIKDLKTSVDILVTAGENTDNRVTTLDKQIGDIQRKIDKTNTNLENLTKVTPTNIGVKDNKLGLKHDTTWLTNQDAITLGDNLTYDDTTRTLNAKGGSNDTAIITLSDSQYGTLTDNATIVLTEEQYNLIISNQHTKIIYNTAVIAFLTLSNLFYNSNNYYTLFGINDIGSSWNISTLQVAKPPLTSYLSQRMPITTANISLSSSKKGFGVFNGDAITEYIYVDTINNVPIIHSKESEIKNYIIGDYTAFQEEDHTNYVKILLKKNNVEEYYGGYVPKALNKTATPKVLRSVNNTMSWDELPKYYEHDGMITVGENYVMIKYISSDSTKLTNLNQVITKLTGNYITASGSFMLGSGQVAMVYGMDFGQNTTLFDCHILDFYIQAIISSDISVSDVEIKGYSENVRLIE